MSDNQSDFRGVVETSGSGLLIVLLIAIAAHLYYQWYRLKQWLFAP